MNWPRFMLMFCIPATFEGVRLAVKVMGDVDGLHVMARDTEEEPTETDAPEMVIGVVS